MKKLIKVFYIGQKSDITECYVLKILDGGYFLMSCELFHSRPWGDPPYWEIPDQLRQRNSNFYALQEHVKLKNDKETFDLRIKRINNDYNAEINSITEEIKELKDDLNFLKEEKRVLIKKIKSEYK